MSAIFVARVSFARFFYVWRNSLFTSDYANFQASANAWPVSKVAIVKCLVIGAVTGSVARIVAIVFMPTLKGAIQSAESASANLDGKVHVK